MEGVKHTRTPSKIVTLLSVIGLSVAASGALVRPAAIGAASHTATAQTQDPALGNTLLKQVSAATQGGDFQRPFDSTPDPQGTFIYFTATSAHGPGIFRVPATGGFATPVVTGQPFIEPHGIAMSADSLHIYIADTAATDVQGATGRVFVLSPHSRSVAVLRGSVGTAPQNVDVVQVGNKQTIYFSGRDPRNGLAAILALPASGASMPTVVAEGTPFVDPDGLVVARSGAIYVADRSAAGNGLGAVFMIMNGKVTTIVAHLRTGNPAGITLAPSQSTLLVSAIQPGNQRAEVLVVDLHTLQTSEATKVVGKNPGAGGLHSMPMKASATQPEPVYSWCGVTGTGSGVIFTITLK